MPDNDLDLLISLFAIQYFTHLGCQILHRKRFLNEIDALVQHAVMGDNVSLTASIKQRNRACSLSSFACACLGSEMDRMRLISPPTATGKVRLGIVSRKIITRLSF